MNIVVLAGGLSTERDVSLNTGAMVRITMCRRVASEQDRRQEEDGRFFRTG